jgi:Holliday junction resolvase RusA-like endonuclease
MQKEIIMIFPGLRASSVNNSKQPYFRAGKMRLVPSKNFKEKEREYHAYILPYAARLQEFFKGVVDGVELHIRFYYHGVLKKNGEISLTGGDISNKVKQLEDVLFKIAKSNDALVTKLIVEKIESASDKIEIEIKKN